MNFRWSILALLALFCFAGFDLMNSIGSNNDSVAQLDQQVVVFILAFNGQRILPALGLDVAMELVGRLQQNKFAAVMGIWFVGNTLTNAIVSTGAFEVYCDGNLIFSKLAEDRMPQLNELYASMDTCLQAFRAQGGALA